MCGELDVGKIKNLCAASVYLQAQWFPADVPEQSWCGAQCVLRPFLQREDDSARVLPQSVDQVFKLPAHLWNTDSRV